MKVIENFRIQPAIRRNVIILLGGPGAGKGTQARAISEWLKVPHISSGQLLRSEVAACTPLGLRAKAIIDAGDLVPDDLVDELVIKRIRNEDCRSGFILDGYPRSVGQAVTLEGNLPMWDRQIVIDLVTDMEKMVARLAYRRTCQGCGSIYHLITAPPKLAGICDSCGGPLIQRSDDHEDVIRERFKTYRQVTERLERLYKRMGVYHGIDGMRPADEVSGDIRHLIEKEIDLQPASAERVAAD